MLEGVLSSYKISIILELHWMKQLCQLVNIHLRSGLDTDNPNLKMKVLQRDSISSVHEAFHEARSLESRLKSNKSQLLRLRLLIKEFSSLETIGNNVQFHLENFFEKDYSTIWEFKILNNSGKILVQDTVDSQQLKLISDLTLKFPQNTVLFEFKDGFYILESKKQVENMSPSNINDSYSLIEFKRIKNLEEGIKKLKTQISEFLNSTADSLKVFKEISKSNLKAKEFKFSIRGIEAAIIENSHQILGIKGKINKVKMILKNKLDSLQDSRNQGKAFAQNCLKIRSLILNNRNSQFEIFQSLARRQKELALETRRIFQINEYSNSINGLIPDFFERHQEKMSSAFGLVAHLISVLFSLNNLRPRYPMVLKGSRCSIIDYISETKSFPMYFTLY